VKVLPYERLTLRTSEPPDAVVARLEKMVAKGWFFWTNPPQPFRGRITGRHFELVRLLGTVLGLRKRNSWQPVIIGDAVPAVDGTEVRVRMRPHAFVAVFTGAWFAGVLWGVAWFLSIVVRDGFDAAGGGLLGTCAMAGFGYALVSWSFWSEVKRARAILCAGLGCAELPPSNRLVRSR
jgi:hypothetical protein